MKFTSTAPKKGAHGSTQGIVDKPRQARIYCMPIPYFFEGPLRTRTRDATNKARIGETTRGWHDVASPLFFCFASWLLLSFYQLSGTGAAGKGPSTH